MQMSNPTKTLVPYYNEAIIQLGFIAFFATAFPFAPLFSFLTNLLEIDIKMNKISKFGRRNFAEGTSGIGNWSSIMGFVSYIAIPINMLILLFCRFPTGVGAFQDLDALLPTEESVMVTYLRSRDGNYWNRANIIMFCILIEHVIIGIKIIISMVVRDLPESVIKDELRRVHLEKKAMAEMFRIKVSGKYETF